MGMDYERNHKVRSVMMWIGSGEMGREIVVYEGYRAKNRNPYVHVSQRDVLDEQAYVYMNTVVRYVNTSIWFSSFDAP